MEVKRYIVWCPDLDGDQDPCIPGQSAKTLWAANIGVAARDFGHMTYADRAFAFLSIRVRHIESGRTWRAGVHASVRVTYEVDVDSEIGDAAPGKDGQDV